MHSPYGKDVVAQFVKSAKAKGINICYYMGPNANGWLSNHQKLSAAAFVEAQLGMLRELLTDYGPIARLWWDHYPSGCGGLAPCPEGSFPDAWPKFVGLVRELSPSTIICPGPDCDGHQGESGIGRYPAWFPCTPSESNGTELKCDGHGPNATLTGFHPYEACATMHNGWFCKGDGTSSKNHWWSAGDIWDHYMNSVGIGWVNTLNAPPGTTGQIPEALVQSMTTFGNSLRALLKPVTETATTATTAGDDPKTISCSSDRGGKGDALEIDLRAATKINAVMMREDLSSGQKVEAYGVDWWDGSAWKAFPALSKSTGGIHGQSVGARMIDFVPETTTTKVRFRCTKSLAADGTAIIKSFSAHYGTRP